MAIMLQEDQFYRISLNTLVPSDRFMNEVVELDNYSEFVEKIEGSGYYTTLILYDSVEESMGLLLEFMLSILQIIEKKTYNKNYTFTTVCLSIITDCGRGIENIETIVVIRRSGVLMKNKFYSEYLDKMKIFLFNMKLESIDISFLDWSGY